MKRILLTLLAACSVVIAGMSGAAHAGVQDFSIVSFEADYYLSRNAEKIPQMQAEERIVARFPYYDQNHGILRAIPTNYQGHPVYLEVQKVTDGSGRALPYEASESNGNRVLRIGDSKKYVQGTQTYHIAYSMRHVINSQPGGDELYWDVNGDQWKQTVGRVTARVHIPPELATALAQEKNCFTGTYGSKEHSCLVRMQKKDSETLITAETTRTMAVGETLTFALGFSKGTFAEYQKTTWEKLRIYVLVLGLGLGPPLLAGVFMYRRWRKFGRDPKGRGTIIPEYLPPKEVSVAAAATVLREKLDSQGVTAQILDLAVNNFIKIYEVKEAKKFQRDKTTYEIELVKMPAQEHAEAAEVARLLFGANAEVGARIKLDKFRAALYSEAQGLNKKVCARLAEEGYFRTDPRKAPYPYWIAGTILFVIGLMGIPLTPFTLGISAAGVVVLIFAWFMPARTTKGVELRDYLLGLKMYMQVAEAERLKMLQSPRGRYAEKIDTTDQIQLLRLYEKLLPYAVLFGIEKEWLKEFAHLYEQPPSWYVGSTPHFQAVVFTNAMMSFSSAATQSFTPSSSSSGSGLGSGGFSGGGGGGGGGGGW